MKSKIIIFLLSLSVAIANGQNFVYNRTTTGVNDYDVSVSGFPGYGSSGIGISVPVKFGSTNTGSCTIKINGSLPAITIQKKVAGALTNLVAGDLRSGDICWISYTGSVFQIELIQRPPQTTMNRLPRLLKTASFTLAKSDTSKTMIVRGASDVAISLSNFSSGPDMQFLIVRDSLHTDSVYFVTGGQAVQFSGNNWISRKGFAYVNYSKDENKFFISAGTGWTTGVSSVSVVTANGVSGSVANPTTTPAITLNLGAITPMSVNAVVISGSSTPTLAVTGATSVSGTNTGNQTTSGTTNRIGVTNGSTNPVIDISASYSGQTSITTVGTITTGLIGPTVGGTNQTTWSIGQMLYASGSNALSKLNPGSNGDVLTISGGIPAWAAPSAIMFFGDGSDGDLTVTTNNLSSGPLTLGTLTRDAYFNNLTISGSGSIKTNGYRLYVKNILDISSAAANAINANGGAPASDGSSSGAAGTASAAVLTATVGGAPVARDGGAGGTAAGTAALASTNNSIANGGLGGSGRQGGSGTSGGGGSANIGGTIAGAGTAMIGRYTDQILFGNTLILGGTAGGGGGGGGGDGTAGGGGGPGGNAGGDLIVLAKIINRGASTAAGALSAKGAAGGNGGSAGAGNRGGGGAGGGGGGGYAYIFSYMLTGSTAINCIDVSGGAGGNGGNGTGTGTGGRGGDGGSGGRIDKIDGLAQTGVHQFGTAGTASATVSGTSGTTGGAGDTEQSNL